MPELPEVESFKKYLDENALDQKIEKVQVSAKGMLIDTTESELIETLKSNFLEETHRHGKFFL
jgi:formamidopyrimidine-DNA glycosylase